MRLAIVSVQDPDDIKVWSGIPSCILSEIRRQGVEVEIIGPLSRWFKWLYAPLVYFMRFRNKSVQIDRHPIALSSFARQITRRMAGKKFDAVLSFSSIPISSLPTGIPVLFWTDAVLQGMADYYAGKFANMSAGELSTGNRQEQAGLNRAAYALYSSEWAVEQAQRFYETRRGAVQALSFGANLPIEHGLEQVTAWIDARSKTPPCTLLFIGVEWERKGGPLAWEVARILNEKGIPTTLRVVGCAAPEAPFVENYGFISKSTEAGRRRLTALYESATFFFLPTRAEAAGIVFCEASAFGLPSLASQTGGVQDYVLHEETGFCLPLDAPAAEYVACITRSLTENDMYRRLSLNAYSRYRTLMNWESSVRRLRRLVEAAMETDRANLSGN